MKSKQTLLLCLLALLPCIAWADIVKGRIIDAQTQEPLPDAEVKITIKLDLCTTYLITSVDSLGRFSCESSGDRCTLEATLIGYYPTKRSFMAGSTRDTLDLGDIKLRPSEIFLKTAVVEGRAKRFVMRGDTVVFNPDAFRLEEGARLDELIKKLPGVTVKDGQLYWMDKPVRILMNGEELFSDNSLLLNRLPAEAVDRIKAYNKASEMKEQTGLDDGAEDHVLDIQIKPGFLDKWYGDAQADYQTTKGYLARLDAMYLSTHDPLMAFLNWENTNRNYFTKTFSSTASGSGDPYGKQIFGATGYKHQWTRPQGTKTLNRFVSLSASAGHNDSWGTVWQNLETFFPGQERTFGLKQTDNSRHSIAPSVEFYSRLELDSVTTVNIRANWSYKKQEATAEERSAVFAADPYLTDDAPLDAVFAPGGEELYDGQLTTRSLYRNFTEAENMTLSASANIYHFFRDKGQLRGGASISYTDDRSEGHTDRDIRYLHEPVAQTRTAELARTPAHSLQAEAEASYRKWFGKNVLFNVGYSYSHLDDFSKEDRFMLSDLPEYAPTAPLSENLLASVLDPANSYRRNTVEDAHNASLSATINIKSFTLMPSLTMQRKHEDMDYRRGGLDTTAVRKQTFWTPNLIARWKLSRSMAVEGNYAYSTTAPDLLETIGYTDDTNPLYVTQGNPDLKNEHSHRAGLKFIANIVSRQQSVTAALNYSTTSTPVSAVYFYNPETGAYRTTWANVRGGTSWGGSLSYEQTAGDFVRIRNDFSLDFGQSYGYLTATTPDYLLQLNRARSIRFRESPSVSFENDRLSVTLSGKYARQHRSNSLSYDYNNNLTDYSTTLDASYKWNQFTFGSTFSLQGHSGYAMSSMNKILPIWNAQVDWKVLHGKGLVTLEVDDILNKQAYYDASVTATERSETRYEFLHHYINLSFTYHFDAKKDKQ